MSSTQSFSDARHATQQAAEQEELFSNSLASLFKGPAIKVRIELDPKLPNRRHPENAFPLSSRAMGLSSKRSRYSCNFSYNSESSKTKNAEFEWSGCASSRSKPKASAGARLCRHQRLSRYEHSSYLNWYKTRALRVSFSDSHPAFASSGKHLSFCPQTNLPADALCTAPCINANRKHFNKHNIY